MHINFFYKNTKSQVTIINFILKYCMIRKANLEDLDAVKKVAETCALHLSNQGIFSME